jgi:hypothetical protein
MAEAIEGPAVAVHPPFPPFPAYPPYPPFPPYVIYPPHCCCGCGQRQLAQPGEAPIGQPAGQPTGTTPQGLGAPTPGRGFLDELLGFAAGTPLGRAVDILDGLFR